MIRTGLKTTLLQTQVTSNLEPLVSYPLEPMKSELADFRAIVVDGEVEMFQAAREPASKLLLEILLVLRIIAPQNEALCWSQKRSPLTRGSYAL